MKQVEPTGKMMLLPPREGLCRICAGDHKPEMPHNAQSIFYAMRFKMRYGRDGTWADALAHCDLDMRICWENALRERAAWTEPPEGVDPISEPIDG